MTIQQFILIFLARKQLFFKVLGAIFFAALVLSLLWPKSYVASVAVVADSKGADPLTGMNGLQAQLVSGYIATQVDIIASHNVALKVVDSLKLIDVPEMREKFNDETSGQGSIRDWLADKLLKDLSVNPSREGSMIDIEVSAREPQYAAQLANAFADAYVQASLEVKVEPARRQAKWFDEQVFGLRATLEQAQQRLATFRRENNIVGTDEQRLDLENTKLAEISNQLVAAQASTYDNVTRLDQVSKASSKESLQQLPDILANPLLQNMKADLVRAEGRLAETAQRYDRNHPQYISAAAEVATLRTKLSMELKTALGAINQATQLSKQREAELQAAFDRQKSRILELQKQRDQQAVLVREVESAQRIYDATLQRASQVRLESQLDQSGIAVLNPAFPPLKPAQPKILLNLILSILIGGIMGMGAVLLAELRDRRVRSREDLIETAGMEVLVEFPQVATKKSGTGLMRFAAARD